MASNDDGTMVVVYGGLPTGTPGNGEVFILNTMTGEWKQGTSGKPRQYTTCTIAGDQLLIWGGTVPENIVSSASVLIYNITANIWTDNYIPPANYVTSPGANATTSHSPTVSNTGPEAAAQGDGKSNMGAIVGGVVGALAVIGAIIGFLLYRRRQHCPISVKTALDHDESVGSTPTSGSGSPHTNITSSEEELKGVQSQLENQQRQFLAPQQPLLLQSPPLAPQDLSSLYGHQPPTFYPATTTTTLIPTLNTVQTLPNASSPPLQAYSSVVPTVSVQNPHHVLE
ncbi:hypothetical protein BGX24_004412 [Mortierella sp. AD032]|nr:hypothetical protein BGX24_004412 [Mortierella sp. AD032]